MPEWINIFNKHRCLLDNQQHADIRSSSQEKDKYLIILTDALSKVLSPTPIAKTGRPYRKVRKILQVNKHNKVIEKKRV